MLYSKKIITKNWSLTWYTQCFCMEPGISGVLYPWHFSTVRFWWGRDPTWTKIEAERVVLSLMIYVALAIFQPSLKLGITNLRNRRDKTGIRTRTSCSASQGWSRKQTFLDFDCYLFSLFVCLRLLSNVNASRRETLFCGQLRRTVFGAFMYLRSHNSSKYLTRFSIERNL